MFRCSIILGTIGVFAIGTANLIQEDDIQDIVKIMNIRHEDKIDSIFNGVQLVNNEQLSKPIYG
jgi:hypothetical protein